MTTVADLVQAILTALGEDPHDVEALTIDAHGITVTHHHPVRTTPERPSS